MLLLTYVGCFFVSLKVDLLKLLDEPVQTNGTTHQHEQQASIFTTPDLLAEFNDVPNNHVQPSKFLFGKMTLFFYINFWLLLDMPPMVALDRNGLRIVFSFERTGTLLTIHSKATNATEHPMTNFVLKAAVPKVKYLLTSIKSIS